MKKTASLLFLTFAMVVAFQNFSYMDMNIESLDPDANFYLDSENFNCDHYRALYMSSTVACITAQRDWLSHGLRLGREGSPHFSIRKYLQENPLLAHFFGGDYRQAWHYYKYVGQYSSYRINEFANLSVSGSGARIYHIDTYAALVNNGDWTPALAAALKEISEHTKLTTNSAELRFAAKKYRMDCLVLPASPVGGTDRYCLEVKNLQRTLLNGSTDADGKKTEIIMNDIKKGFISFNGGRNIDVQNLIVDWRVAPFVQGKIRSFIDSTNTFEVIVQLDSSFPHLDDKIIEDSVIADSHEAGNFILMDAKAPHRKIGTHSFTKVSGFQRIVGTDHVKFIFQKSDSNSQVADLQNEADIGDQFVFAFRGGAAAFSFQEIINIQINKLTIHATPSVSLVFTKNTGYIRLNQLVIRPREGSGKIISSSGGGINAGQNRVTFLLQNSYFSGLSDDAFAAPSTGAFVVGQSNLTQVQIASSRELIAGDLLQFVDPQNGKVFGERRISSVVISNLKTTPRIYDVTLDTSVETLNIGKGLSEIPQRSTDFTNTVVYTISAAGPNSLFRDNIFGYNRGSALRVRGNGSTVIRNSVLLVGTSAIESSSMVRSFVLGPIPENISIINNFAYGAANTPSCQICIEKETLSNTGIVETSVPGIVIEKNLLVNPFSSERAISLKNMTGVTLRDNRIIPKNPQL